MPGLASSLRLFEVDQLRQVALLWGINPEASDRTSLLLTLETELQQPGRFLPVYNQLTKTAQQALAALKANDGRLPWSTFAQRFGEIRALGKTLRKKEQPWAFPASVSESLWYHGLIGRDFLRLENDLQEMAYLPDEIIPLIPSEIQQEEHPLIPVHASKQLVNSASHTAILDEICILLAAFRFEDPQDFLNKTTLSPHKIELLQTLLFSIGIIDSSHQPTELARKVLELPRKQALGWLAKQWLTAEQFHEIDLLPGLRLENHLAYRSQSARQDVVNTISGLQAERWYSTEDLAEYIRSNNPDFLRQQEEYFSWVIIHQANPQEQLTGYESWMPVEGSLIKFVVLHMLPLFGLADTGNQPGSGQLFRLNQNFFSLISGGLIAESESEDEPVNLTSMGKIDITSRSPLIVRFQVSRFVEWLEVSPTHGTYQITPDSLKKAGRQGLQPKHLIQLLRKHAAGGLPPLLYEAIKRWEKEGAQASIQTKPVLRVSSPELLQSLRETPAAAWFEESLGPAAVTIKPGGEKTVMQALAGLGYLTDYNESEK